MARAGGAGSGSNARRNGLVLLQVLGVAALAAGGLAVTTMVAVMVGGTGSAPADRPYPSTGVSSQMPDVSFLDAPGGRNESTTAIDPQTRTNTRRVEGDSPQESRRPKGRDILDLGDPTEILDHATPPPLPSPVAEPPMPDDEGLVVEIVEDIGGITNGVLTGAAP